MPSLSPRPVRRALILAALLSPAGIAHAADLPLAARLGTPPVPPGSTAIPCPRQGDQMAFTLNRPPSPTYLAGVRAMAEEAKRPVDPRDAAAREPRPFAAEFERMREAWALQGGEAEQTAKEISDTLRRAGYRPSDSAGPAIWYRDFGKPTQVTALIRMQTWKEQKACLASGIAIPAGPMVLFQ